MTEKKLPFTREQWEAAEGKRYLETPDEVLDDEDAEEAMIDEESMLGNLWEGTKEIGGNLKRNAQFMWDVATDDKEYALNTDMLKGAMATYGNSIAQNWGDEALAAAQSMIGQGSYEENVAANRQYLEGFKEQHPELANRLDTGGMIASGIMTMPLGGPAITAGKAATQAGLLGAARGSGEGEGFGESLQGGIYDGVTGAVAGAALSKIAPWALEKVMKAPGAAKRLLYADKVFKNITRDRGKVADRFLGAPIADDVSIEGLRHAKNAAYADPIFDRVKFKKSTLIGMVDELDKALKAPGKNFNPQIHSQTRKMVNKIKKTVKNNDRLSIKEIEELRQASHRVINKPEEAHLHDEVAGVLDDMIHKLDLPSTKAAREANRIYRTTKDLDDALTRAAQRAHETGSGGNIQNYLMQEVGKILRGRNAKYFTDKQREAMQYAIDLGDGEQLARIVGKMAPGGNGLMTFLTTQFSVKDPRGIALQAMSYLAKKHADKVTQKNTRSLLKAIAKGQEPPIPTKAMIRGRYGAAKAGSRAGGLMAREHMQDLRTGDFYED